jgi:glycine cleavage system H protein
LPLATTDAIGTEPGMKWDDSNSLFYKRSHFLTRLPLDRLYTGSHYWLFERKGAWRIGITQFGARMLGEMVDYSLEGLQFGAPIHVGQVIGWIEGLKTLSDVFCAIDGKFECINAQLGVDPEVLHRDCYGEGWLYEASGLPDPQCLSVHGYKALLEKTIDELIEKRQSSE